MIHVVKVTRRDEVEKDNIMTTKRLIYDDFPSTDLQLTTLNLKLFCDKNNSLSTKGLPNIDTDITSLQSKTGKHRTSSILYRKL